MMVSFTHLIGVVTIFAGLAYAAPASSSSIVAVKSSSAIASSSKPSSSSTRITATSTSYPGSTVVSTASSTYYTPIYGSGSWGKTSYEDCIEQCFIEYAVEIPTVTYMPTVTATTIVASSASTHTVIVGPTAGVNRYVPFAVNASIGDVIEFIWNADVQTVTESSESEICSEVSSTSFNSGMQNAGFVFTQVVNSVEPTFFFSAASGSCESGMFGIINPATVTVSNSTSLSSMMPAMIANSSTMSAMWTYTGMMTANNSVAASWGANLDMSSMPEWAVSYVAENVMYTSSFLAANPATLSADGAVDLGNLPNDTIAVPMDIFAALSNSTAVNAANTTSTATSSMTSATMTNAAKGFGAPRLFVGLAITAGAVLIF